MTCKCNKLYIGLIVGLILPVLTSWLIFYFRFGDSMKVENFISNLIKLGSLTKLLSVSVISNLIVFLVAIKLDRLLAARGILTATLIYAVAIIILKFTLQ